MAASQITLTLSAAAGGGTVVIPLPTALTALDSGQTASSQTGFNAVDTMVRNICRQGGCWTSDKSVFYPLFQIVSISWS